MSGKARRCWQVRRLGWCGADSIIAIQTGRAIIKKSAVLSDNKITPVYAGFCAYSCY
jgi:hypothetical protein